MNGESFDKRLYERRQRAYEQIAKAMELEQDGHTAKAEKAYVKGIASYRKDDPNGADFALGRYAAFLIAQERDDDARSVLEEAIAHQTDIPAIWGDYEWLLLRQKDVERLCWAISNRVTGAGSTAHSHAESILVFARHALRHGDAQIAWTLAERAFQEAAGKHDDEGRFATLGLMGAMHEKAASLDTAIEIWSKALDEGSKDPVTADRLSLNLERRKEYAAAIQVIDTALERGLPANKEEQLRKRRERCRARLSGTKPADVQAYSERHGAGAFACRFQARVKPPPRDLDVLGSTARCFGISKGAGAIVDLDLAGGNEVQRVEDLPGFDYLQMSPTGWGIAIERTAAVGKGETKLCFLRPEGIVYATGSVPDATSDVALGPNVWYVGCRDGGLYAFDLGGKSLWRWETPGSREYDDNPYFRPCPYHVAANDDFIAIGSLDTLYALRYDGAELWHTTLPTDPPVQHTAWLPLGAPSTRTEAFERLGLKHSADEEEIKTAYRRAAKATHPDVNRGDTGAAERFRLVHAAYETLMRGDGATEDARGDVPGISVSITFSPSPPLSSFVHVRESATVVGSSNGRVCVYDERGRLTESHALGRSTAAPAALHDDGSLAAVWSDGTLFFFSRGAPTSSAEMETPPHGMLPLGDDILVWRDNNLRVVNRAGATVWDVDFAKKIVAIDVVGEEIVCAAGAVMVFARAGG